MDPEPGTSAQECPLLHPTIRPAALMEVWLRSPPHLEASRGRSVFRLPREQRACAWKTWDYDFDFGDRQYSARLYTDEPNVAYVNLSRGGRWTRLALWRDASRDPLLHTIRRHLRADTGRPIEVHALTPWGGNRGYRRVALD